MSTNRSVTAVSAAMNASEDSEERVSRPRLDSFSSSSSSYGSLRLSGRGAGFASGRPTAARSRRKRTVAPGVPAPPARKRRVPTSLPRNNTSPSLLPSISAGGLLPSDSSLAPPLAASEVGETALSEANGAVQDKSARTVRRKKSDKLKVDTTRVGSQNLAAPATSNLVTSPPNPAKIVKTKKKETVSVGKDAAALRPVKVQKATQNVGAAPAPVEVPVPVSVKPKIAAPKKRRSMKEMSPPVIAAPTSALPSPLASFASPQVSNSAIVTSPTSSTTSNTPGTPVLAKPASELSRASFCFCLSPFPYCPVLTFTFYFSLCSSGTRN